MIALVNSPPVASDPVPVAGQRALATPVLVEAILAADGPEAPPPDVPEPVDPES